MKEHDVTGRVAGAMMNGKTLRADRDLVAIDEPAVGRKGSAMVHAEAVALRRQLIDPERVLALGPFHGDGETRGEIGDGPGVIEVPMRHQHLLDDDVALLGDGENPLELAAGIDDGGALRLATPNERAILLKGRHRNDDALERSHCAEMTGARNPVNWRRARAGVGGLLLAEGGVATSWWRQRTGYRTVNEACHGTTRLRRVGEGRGGCAQLHGAHLPTPARSPSFTSAPDWSRVTGGIRPYAKDHPGQQRSARGVALGQQCPRQERFHIVSDLIEAGGSLAQRRLHGWDPELVGSGTQFPRPLPPSRDVAAPLTDGVLFLSQKRFDRRPHVLIQGVSEQALKALDVGTVHESAE